MRQDGESNVRRNHESSAIAWPPNGRLGTVVGPVPTAVASPWRLLLFADGVSDAAHGLFRQRGFCAALWGATIQLLGMAGKRSTALEH